MSQQTPEFNSASSPFDTFHVPLTDVVTQSVEEMLAGNFSTQAPPEQKQAEPQQAEASNETPQAVEAEDTSAEFIEVPKPYIAEETATSEPEIPAPVAKDEAPIESEEPQMVEFRDQTAESASVNAASDVDEVVTQSTPNPENATQETVQIKAEKTSTSEPQVDTTVASEAAAAKPGVADNEVVPEPPTGFRALALSEDVQKAIEATGYTTPTDIQAQIIPHVLDGRDVLAQSQTGTGKTAAFALPVLSRISVSSRKPQVLVLAPTRELAMQVAASFSTYGKQIPGFDVAAVYGGQGYDTQLRQLRRGVPVVVGTPGRVIDHIKRRTMDLSELRCLVLDEADEMLNMGFLEDVKFVLEQTPSTRQVALFSATLPGPIQKIAQQYLNDPVRISIKRKTMTADAIRQRAVFASPREKLDVLTRFLGVEDTDGVIIFTKTREATVAVAEHLLREGYKAVALNGDMAQNVRERTISNLKSGRLDILVATDVAARGLDVSRVSHVFNFDVPQDSESYVHRIGRTGRAGRKGEAIILLSSSQRYKLRQIERLTRQSIEIVPAPTANDINASRVQQFKKKLTEVIDSKDLELFTKILTEYAEESGKSMEVIAAALAEVAQNGRPFFVQDRPGRRRQEGRGDRDGRDERSNRDRSDRFGNDRRERSERPRPRRAGRVEAGMDRYRIEVGHDDGVMPGNIVGAVANEAGIEGEFIGPINIYDHYSTIDLPEGMPREVHDVLQAVRVAGKPLRLRKASESDNHGESGGGGSRNGGGGGRSFSRGPKRFGGKPRNSGSGGRFDRKKRKPRD